MDVHFLWMEKCILDFIKTLTYALGAFFGILRLLLKY